MRPPTLRRLPCLVIVNGGSVPKPGEIYHLGFDLDRGELGMSIASGSDPLFNGAFIGIQCDRSRALAHPLIT